MKHIRNLFFGLLVLASTSSCEKFLEIKPEGEIPTEEALKTPRDVQMLLNSCYDVMRSGRFYGGKVQILSELMGDNMDGRVLSGNWLSYHSHNTSIFNSESREVWSEPYIMVYRINSLFENIDLVPGMTADETKRTLAEAHFLRGMAHFEIVRLFAQPWGYTADNSHVGIPIRLSPSQEALPRSTVAEVYAAVIADFEAAAADLPLTNNGYATQWAAKAYLARVYFQMNNFQKAYDYADDVIANGGFSLHPDIMFRFSQSANSENIFTAISTGQQNSSGSALSSAWRSTDISNPPGARISSDLYDIAVLDTNDQRGKGWYVLANAGQPNQLVLLTRYNENWFSVPVLHLAEMLLIRAESAAELGNTAVATADLNAIRTRAGATPVVSGLDAASLILLIRTERRLELVGEGHRLQDLKRQGARGVVGVTINGAPWNCDGMAVQLPDEELAGNPSIVLNPTGGCN
jgi:hypothetical protein